MYHTVTVWYMHNLIIPPQVVENCPMTNKSDSQKFSFNLLQLCYVRMNIVMTLYPPYGSFGVDNKGIISDHPCSYIMVHNVYVIVMTLYPPYGSFGVDNKVIISDHPCSYIMHGP